MAKLGFRYSTVARTMGSAGCMKIKVNELYLRKCRMTIDVYEKSGYL
jgi:hypothetical protein